MVLIKWLHSLGWHKKQPTCFPPLTTEENRLLETFEKVEREFFKAAKKMKKQPLKKRKK